MTIPIGKFLADLVDSGGAPPHESPPDFSPAMQALNALVRARGNQGGHLVEAAHRLRQLQWIVNRVWALEQSLERSATLHLGTGAATDADLEIMILCESFYLLAWRFTTPVGQLLGGRPGARPFSPRGVDYVRNKLLEHTKVSMWTFATGRGLPHGPRLKPFGLSPDDPIRDRGLYANADELIEQFVKKASRATAHHQSKIGSDAKTE